MGRWAPYRTCRSCGTGFWIPPQKSYYWGQGVDPSDQQHRIWSGRHDLWINTAGPGPGRLLDIGCGFGHFVAWARVHGWDAWGYDSDTWAVERAVADGFVTSDADRIDGHFDLITMWDVLEHQTDPIAFLDLWKQRVRPGGRVLVAVPNFESMKLRWPVYRHRASLFSSVINPGEHAVQFTPTGLRIALSNAGLLNVRIMRPPLSHGSSFATRAVQRWPALRRGMFACGESRAESAASLG